MKTIVFGRGQECDVVIDDLLASKRHMEIIQHDGRFTIRDLGSTNGTFVNGKMVMGEQEIGPYASVEIGTTLVSWRQYFPEDPTFPQSSHSEQPVAPTNAPAPKQETSAPKQRNTFVTIFLWLLGFWFLFHCVFAITTLMSTRCLLGWRELAFNAVELACVYLLFCWRKLGFKVLLGVELAGALKLIWVSRRLFLAHSIFSTIIISTALLLYILPPLFLYLTLQIRKNGVSAWNNLE